MDAHRAKQQEALAKRFILIPMEIFFDDKLTPCDKIIYGRINTFDEFFESNAKTAELLNISDKQVKRSKRQLLDLDYIRIIGNDGRGKRYAINQGKLTAIRRAIADEIASCPGVLNGETACVCEGTICPTMGTICPEKGTICPTENKKRIKRELKEKQTKEKTDGSEQQFGNPDVNAMLDAWTEATGFDLKNQKMERYAMAGLIKQHGLDATKALINRVKRARRSDDQFAPQIAKPSQLRGKYSKLEALTLWEERQGKAAQALRKANPIRLYQQNQPEPTEDAPDTPEARAERQRIAQELRAKFIAKMTGDADE